MAEHRRDHEALALADPRHADGEDVVLGLGEQPGAGGDVDPEGQWLAPRERILPVEGGGVAIDGLATHPPLDVGTTGSRRTAVSFARYPEATDQ